MVVIFDSWRVENDDEFEFKWKVKTKRWGALEVRMGCEWTSGGWENQEELKLKIKNKIQSCLCSNSSQESAKLQVYCHASHRFCVFFF